MLYPYYINLVIYSTTKWWRLSEEDTFTKLVVSCEKGLLETSGLKSHQQYIYGSESLIKILRYWSSLTKQRLFVRAGTSSTNFRLYFATEMLVYEFLLESRALFNLPFLIATTLHGPNFVFRVMEWLNLLKEPIVKNYLKRPQVNLLETLVGRRFSICYLLTINRTVQWQLLGILKARTL